VGIPKEFFKLPFWALTLLIGAPFVLVPYLDVASTDRGYRLTTHSPGSMLPVYVGIALLIASILAFAYSLIEAHRKAAAIAMGAGIDLSRVSDTDGMLSTCVGSCRIGVREGRIEDFARASAGLAVVLPCNEYFDDRCIQDSRSALGAFAQSAFEGQTAEFLRLVADESARKLGPGQEEQQTSEVRARSYGPGRCLLLMQPLNRSFSVALVSTTTQRAGQGLSARISYLFDGMRELMARLADSRISEVVMPVLGSGHGGIDPPLALVGLLLALAEAARYGQGAQRLRSANIVVFRRDKNSALAVDLVVVRRALALIGSRS
jgi:hypothetical protein